MELIVFKLWNLILRQVVEMLDNSPFKQKKKKKKKKEGRFKNFLSVILPLALYLD